MVWDITTLLWLAGTFVFGLVIGLWRGSSH